MAFYEGKLNYIETVNSVNRYLLDYPEALEDFTAVYTLNQTKGRGRLGRKWEESKGESLALSVLINLPAQMLPPLPLVVGIAVSEVLEEYLGFNVGLKWSNDILINNKKVVGILCDSRSYKASPRVAIGIGINLFQTKDFFDKNNLPYASSLQLMGLDPLDPEKLSISIVENLANRIKQYVKEGFEKTLLPLYESKCITLGKVVMVESGTERRTGTAVKINIDGGLWCDFNGTSALVYGGEVSVRGLYGYID